MPPLPITTTFSGLGNSPDLIGAPVKCGAVRASAGFPVTQTPELHALRTHLMKRSSMAATGPMFCGLRCVTPYSRCGAVTR